MIPYHHSQPTSTHAKMAITAEVYSAAWSKVSAADDAFTDNEFVILATTHWMGPGRFFNGSPSFELNEAAAHLQP